MKYLPKVAKAAAVSVGLLSLLGCSSERYPFEKEMMARSKLADEYRKEDQKKSELYGLESYKIGK